MARQARVRVGGRPQGRTGIDEFFVISSLLAREDLRVGAAPVPEQTTFIGLRIKDKQGKPVRGFRVLLKLPDGSERPGVAEHAL